MRWCSRSPSPYVSDVDDGGGVDDIDDIYDDDDENFWGDAVGVGLLMSQILVALSVTPALTAATIIEGRHDDDQGSPGMMIFTALDVTKWSIMILIAQLPESQSSFFDSDFQVGFQSAAQPAADFGWKSTEFCSKKILNVDQQYCQDRIIWL